MPEEETTEQQYQAELLRERQREQQMNIEEAEREMELAEAEDLSQAGTPGQAKAPRSTFSLSAIAVGLWLFPAAALDMFEFFGQALAAIPFIGLPLAGASSIVGAIFSGIMVLIVGFWLLMKGITPFSPTGMKIFLVLGATAFGNAIVNWLPAWSGFFLWLFFMTHAREALFLNKFKK